MRGFINRILRSDWMFLWLFILGFLENTVLLIAVEPLFVPVMAAKRKRAYLIALTLVAGCLAGALATYWAAAALYEPFIAPLLERFDLAGDFERVRGDVEERGFLAMFLIGVMPIPFQLGTIASGVVGLALPFFIAAVVSARMIRYGFLALLVKWIGRRAETFFEERQLEIVIGFTILFLIMIAITLML